MNTFPRSALSRVLVACSILISNSCSCKDSRSIQNLELIGTASTRSKRVEVYRFEAPMNPFATYAKILDYGLANKREDAHTLVVVKGLGFAKPFFLSDSVLLIGFAYWDSVPLDPYMIYPVYDSSSTVDLGKFPGLAIHRDSLLRQVVAKLTTRLFDIGLVRVEADRSYWVIRFIRQSTLGPTDYYIVNASEVNIQTTSDTSISVSIRWEPPMNDDVLLITQSQRLRGPSKIENQKSGRGFIDSTIPRSK